MRNFFFLLLVLFGIGLPCAAQESVAEGAAKAKPALEGNQAKETLPPDAASREQVLKLLDVLQARRNSEIMLDGLRQQVKNGAEQGLRQKISNPTPQQVQELRGMIDEVFSDVSVNDVIESLVPVYQRHLTRSDVDAIAAFYASPAGQKFLREQPAMMRESMQAAGAQQQQRVAVVRKKLEQRLNQMLQEQEKQKPAEK